MSYLLSIEFASLLLIACSGLYIAWIACHQLSWLGKSNVDNHHVALSAPITSQFSWKKNLTLLLQILIVVLLSRFVIYLVAYFSFSVINENAGGFSDLFKHIWWRWDSFHYINIANNGYVAEGQDRYLLVFYPLYPMLIAIMKGFIADTFYAGVAVSLINLTLSCFFLFKLVAHEFNDESTAWKTVKYLLLFPFSFFTAIVYTESTFLLMSIACFYYMRQGLWWQAGCFGLLAALTRNHGVLLLAPMAFEMIRQHQAQWPEGWGAKIKFITPKLLALALIPSGIILYLVLNKWVTGDWFRFLDYQKENWHNGFGYFAENVSAIFDRTQDQNYKMAAGTWWPTFVGFFLSIALIVTSIRKVPSAYVIYSFCYLIISYSPTWLLSGPRYLMGLFPLFIFMALWAKKHPSLENTLDIALGLFLTLFVVLFFHSAVY
ncbi:hypothetical protein [Motilimonas eburnea]|uniref:hypothetical protein n=1 Tax=Motilimonas eburnea TaxID=1737488 RepID=UPI001E4FC35A|nr:hypothetical protein [Motilimonas eburnea]MCE2573496.1 hypothetical protein [Motilimonas eburnea]